MESIWQLTSRESPRGDIGKLSNEDIAAGIEYAENEDVLIEALVSCGWLEMHDEYRLVVHDWHDHADDALNMRLARARQAFWCGTPPKTTRLSKAERAECDIFFASVRTKLQSVRTTGAHDMRTPSAPPQPQPQPSPAPPLPEPSPTTTPPVRAHGEFPDSAAAVRERFPDTRNEFIARLTIAVGQKVDGLNGHVKGELTDRLIAKAVRCCSKSAPKQTSAGLYLTTVPQCVATWLTSGEPPEPTTNPIFNPDDYGI